MHVKNRIQASLQLKLQLLQQRNLQQRLPRLQRLQLQQRRQLPLLQQLKKLFFHVRIKHAGILLMEDVF